jgi:hypothetical protein
VLRKNWSAPPLLSPNRNPLSRSTYVGRRFVTLSTGSALPCCPITSGKNKGNGFAVCAMTDTLHPKAKTKLTHQQEKKSFFITNSRIFMMPFSPTT